MCFHTRRQLESHMPRNTWATYKLTTGAEPVAHRFPLALLQLIDSRPAIPIVRGLAGNRKIRSAKQKRHPAIAEWREYLNQAA